MEAVVEFARDGGPVLGICNGFQVLCEAGLLPGALLPNDSLRSSAARWRSIVENPDTPFTRACDEGDALSIPVKHTTGRYYAPDPARCRRTQVVLRYAAGHNPNGSMRRHRRRVQRGRERDGAHAAPRARGRPAHRVRRRRQAVRVAGAMVRRVTPWPLLLTGSSASPTPSTTASASASAASRTRSSWPCSR